MKFGNWIISQLEYLFFFCDWVKSDGGIVYEEFGLTLVNLNRLGHKSDRFMLASQAKQVFLCRGPFR